MDEKSRYPRVLLVLLNKVCARDLTNLLIRAQFAGWPKDSLAQIYSNDQYGSGEYCTYYYKIRPNDRLFGSLFQIARRRAGKIQEEWKVKIQEGVAKSNQARSFVDRVKYLLVEMITKTGLWEVMFPLKMSSEMIRFIEEFKPDVIYCQGYTLGFSQLPIDITNRFKIPICFQTTDDWPKRAYQWSPVGILLRLSAFRLVKRAAVRMAFGAKMKDLYEKRYEIDFVTTFHLDDVERFAICEPRKDDCVKIVYSGSLGHRRYEAIIDLAKALEDVLPKQPQIEIYTTEIEVNIEEKLNRFKNVKICPLPSHDDLPAILTQATILFLPESFNESKASIELSISTKAHLYMMTGRPILVYGPEYSGTVDYALRDGWAVVVSKKDLRLLRESVIKIAREKDLVREIACRAKRCVESNHDGPAGRLRFRELIGSAVRPEQK